MSSAVVRCPACRGASRVPSDAVGQMVACPRCEAPFVAEVDGPVVPTRVRGAPVNRPRATAQPVAPPRRRPPPPPPPERRLPPTEYEAAAPEEVPDPVHDPHRPPVAGLPVSVLVGLALLPFAIPPLWLVAPLITGQQSSLSVAVPVSLSVAAAALCLGVVYTIDWTATTRIKGVLMLVGLAYLSAAGLFFLKKELVDRLHGFFGPTHEWSVVRSVDGKFEVKMPGEPLPVKPLAENDQPLPGLKMKGTEAKFKAERRGGNVYAYLIAFSELPPPADPDDAWFNRTRDKLKTVTGGQIIGKELKLNHPDARDGPGRQWEFQFGGDTVRIVRVYVIAGRVYYLHAEGPQLRPDDEFADDFFKSFRVK